MPVAIMHPKDDGQHSWFVPLEVGPKLVGFAQILPTLQPLRFSSFLRSPGKYEECPDVADWTNSERVLVRAAGIKKQDEQVDDPILTYDQAPTRLAWRVTARSPSGAVRSLYVAGTAVYEATRSPGWG